jgi:DNA polymerase-3 subunit beta
MKLISSQENLARGLAAVKNAVATRASLPILSNILIEAIPDANRARLAATNLLTFSILIIRGRDFRKAQ